MVERMIEDPGSDAFFYKDCASSIFIFVYSRRTLSLYFEQRAHHRGPPQKRGISEMEYVMKPVVVLLRPIVGETVSYIYPSTTLKYIGLTTDLSLLKLHLDVARQLL